MRKLFILFSIVIALFNINNLNANNNDSFNEDEYYNQLLNDMENFDLDAHLQNLENIHDIVWNTNSFFEHIQEILNEFRKSPHGDTSYFYAREILTRMIQDDAFKLDATLHNPYFLEMRNVLSYCMDDFMYWYNEYLNDNTDNEFREMVFMELLNFGYNGNPNNFDEYAETCVRLYEELQ